MVQWQLRPGAEAEGQFRSTSASPWPAAEAQLSVTPSGLGAHSRLYAALTKAEVSLSLNDSMRARAALDAIWCFRSRQLRRSGGRWAPWRQSKPYRPRWRAATAARTLRVCRASAQTKRGL